MAEANSVDMASQNEDALLQSEGMATPATASDRQSTVNRQQGGRRTRRQHDERHSAHLEERTGPLEVTIAHQETIHHRLAIPHPLVRSVLFKSLVKQSSLRKQEISMTLPLRVWEICYYNFCSFFQNVVTNATRSVI